MAHGANDRTKEAFFHTDPVTGREILQLTRSGRHSVHGYYDLPPWSPRDGRIVFTRMAHAGATEGDIGVMNRDGSDLHFVAHSHSVSPNDGAMAQWSADGRRVCFRDRAEGRSALAWVDPDSGESGHFPGGLRMVCPVGNRQAWHTEFHRLPDEDIVRRREEFGVFVQDLVSGENRRLATYEECRRIHPRCDEIADWHLYIKHAKWSPDGTRLFFVFTNEIVFDRKYSETPRVKDIYVIDANDSAAQAPPARAGLRRLGEFGNHPLWHPNGREILANCALPGREGMSLTLIDVETGERRLATRAVPGSGHPSFSPDGRWIAVEKVAGHPPLARISVVDVQPDAVELLAQAPVTNHSHSGTHLHPVWSRDSRQLLFASDASGTAQLCVITI